MNISTYIVLFDLRGETTQNLSVITIVKIVPLHIARPKNRIGPQSHFQKKLETAVLSSSPPPWLIYIPLTQVEGFAIFVCFPLLKC